MEAAREEGRKEGEKSAREKKEKEAIQAEKGKFFTPWSEIWDQQCVDKSKCNGALDRVSRTKDFAENIPEYKDILDRSKSQKTKAAELDQDFSDLNVNDNGDHSSHKGKKKNKAKSKDRVAPNALQPSYSKSSSSFHSSSGSLSSNNMGSPTSNGSLVSILSQSNEWPDFSGRIPSTRAHMIPNVNNSTCYKYFITICQAVLGIDCRDQVRLEKIASGLAESDYNFICAPREHGNYFDHQPCWILVPACPLDSIKNWSPGDAYPVLAVANSSGGIDVEMAYQIMCPFVYDGDNFDAKERKNSDVLKGQNVR